jgi:hypothetical protein
LVEAAAISAATIAQETEAVSVIAAVLAIAAALVTEVIVAESAIAAGLRTALA